MENQVRDTLVELGYDVNLLGAKYVEEVVFQLIAFISNSQEQDRIKLDKITLKNIENSSNSIEEIEEKVLDERIKEMLPRFYLEAYHFDLEVGANTYFKRINEFFESKRAKSKNAELHRKIFKNGYADFSDAIVLLAKYFSSDSKELLDTKQKVDADKSNVYIKRFEQRLVAE